MIDLELQPAVRATLSTMKWLARYGGFMCVAIEWLGLILCVSLVDLNLAEPASQYGYYPETRFIFGIGFSLASLSYYIFSRQLDRYWHWTSRLSLIAGVGLSLTAWVPYKPFVSGFVFDAHNVLVGLSVICYSVPMYMISYKRRHHIIAQFSRLACLVVFSLSILTFIQRAHGAHVLTYQIATASCFQLWILGVNYLTLKQPPLAPAATKL